MDAPPPTKPPRGIKASKETSGLLMSIIRNHSKSESNDQRDREKGKLEREFKKTDQQLNELVSTYNEDLTQVMQLFGNISTAVSISKQRLVTVKGNLLACKALLSCRRDELKKLWLEGVEHKHVLELLEQIEELSEVPSKLGSYLNQGQYLDATKLLVSALNKGEGPLKGVEAITELRHELALKKENLYKQLLDKLVQELYSVSSSDIERFRNESSSVRNRTKWSTKALQYNFESRGENEVYFIDGERVTAITMLVECLALLNKFNDAIESIKVGMPKEMFSVVSTISWALVSNPIEGVHPLLDLLNTLTHHLRKIAENHKNLLRCFTTAADKYHISVTLFKESDIWCSIQAVIQRLLNYYLDIQNTTAEGQQVQIHPFHEQTGDISSYFLRRRTPRTRKLSLFRFEYSSHAVSCGKQLQSQTSVTNLGFGDSKQREKFLVTSPDPYNITVIQVPLHKFIEEIEAATKSSPCSLNTFVNDYIREVFISRVKTTVYAKIESATKTSDAWRTPTSVVEMNELGLVRPVLQSTAQVSKGINELVGLTDSLPNHREQILGIIVALIKGYSETCLAAYRGIVQPEPEDKRLCSAAWLKDDDINRFLKTLPNWTDLQAQKSQYRSEKGLKREDTVEEESPEEVRQRNIKEAEILASNLGEGGIGPHEIISDRLQLKCLAQMQESMEWFAWRLLQIIAKIKKSSMGSPSIDNSGISTLLTSLNQLSRDFEEHSNTCLLVLHLEVRVQCFHYLLPRATNLNSMTYNNGVNHVSYSREGNPQDPDPKVLELSRVLVAIDEALSTSLQTRKLKYIFEGLGHLIAKILMSSTQYMEKIDEAAIHKMCRNIFTLQQTLTNITMAREVALDHARNYFQLFFCQPEEILSKVLEKGPEFTELEYMNAFQLIARTYSPGDQGAVQRHLQRLSDILGEVGVTV